MRDEESFDFIGPDGNRWEKVNRARVIVQKYYTELINVLIQTTKVVQVVFLRENLIKEKINEELVATISFITSSCEQALKEYTSEAPSTLKANYFLRISSLKARNILKELRKIVGNESGDLFSCYGKELASCSEQGDRSNSTDKAREICREISKIDEILLKMFSNREYLEIRCLLEEVIAEIKLFLYSSDESSFKEHCKILSSILLDVSSKIGKALDKRYKEAEKDIDTLYNFAIKTINIGK